MIAMCIRLVVQAAISFRAAPKAVHIAFSNFIAVQSQRIPTHKTICRWLTQIGLYKLNQPKEKADDWAVIIDNSVQIGVQKCLMILGIRLSKFQRKALTFEDMEVLVMELHDQSDTQTVCTALEKAQVRVGKIAVVCADDGPDLRGGVSLFCKKHHAGRIFDVTHKIGTFLKHFLKKEPKWQAFISATAEAKKRMQQTEAAHLAPPNQRSKSRFLNIEILVNWGVDIITALDNPNHADRKLLEKYCGWIHQYRGLISRLGQLVIISQSVRQHIREQGICRTTAEEVDRLLETAMERLDFDMRACEYAGRLIDFLHGQSKIVPFGQIWIGSSEIIESLFGKLKCLEHDQSKGGFTSLVLGAVACVGKLDVEMIKAAMAQIRVADVEAWTREQMGVTLLSKRRQALGSWRKKQSSKKKEHDSTGITLGEAVGF
jgi:hypothetical protein